MNQQGYLTRQAEFFNSLPEMFIHFFVDIVSQNGVTCSQEINGHWSLVEDFLNGSMGSPKNAMAGSAGQGAARARRGSHEGAVIVTPGGSSKMVGFTNELLGGMDH